MGSPMPIGDERRPPLASVITIFLNGEKYIGEAIESILAQTVNDWELILVDDGSNDGATAIARHYARVYPDRIVYTEHPGHENRGMSASRNLGLRTARGKYVGFLDADDIWLPRHLEVLTGILEQRSDVDLVFGRTLYWRSWASKGHVDEALMDAALPYGQVLQPPAVMLNILGNLGGTVPGVCSIVARREDVLTVGGFDDDFRTLFEDQVFFARMFMNYRALLIEDVLDFYRQHPESACNSATGKGDLPRAQRQYVRWLRAYFREQRVSDQRLLQALDAYDRYYREKVFLQRLRRVPRRLFRIVVRRLPSSVRRLIDRRFRATLASLQNESGHK